MTHIRILFAAVVLGSAFTLQAAADDAHHPKTQAQPAAATGLAQGEVRKVDQGAGKITLTHSAWIDAIGKKSARELPRQRVAVDIDQELEISVA